MENPSFFKYPSVLTAGILGGVVAFFWKIFSWEVLPWHKALMHRFTNEDLVSSVIRENASSSGVYFSEKGPLIFSMVDLQGTTINLLTYIIALALQILGACLISWLLIQTKRNKYWDRVFFVTTIALLIAVLAYLPEWNWIRFAGGYTLVRIFDTIFTWFLAGLVIAKFTKKNLFV